MLRTILILSILIPGLFMALRDRFIALLLYLWYGFFRPHEWMWMDITPFRPSLVLGLVLIVPALATGLMPNFTHPLSVGSALFLLSTLASQISAVEPAVGWEWIDFMARLIVVCLLAVTLITTKQRLLRVIAVVGGSIGFHSAKAGVVSVLGGGVQFHNGLGGAFADNNGYALGTVMIMPLLLAVALNAEELIDNAPPWMTRAIRWGFAMAIPLSAMTVISTFSRGGFVALAAALMMFVALHQARVRLTLVLGALVIVGLAVVPIPRGYYERLETIATYEEIGEYSAMSRPHFWRVAALMAEQSPLGVGTRQYEYAYDDYDFSHGMYGTGRSVHSSHFQVLAEQGYPGAIIWAGMFIYAYWVALRVRRLARDAALTSGTSNFLTNVCHCLLASMTGFLAGGSFVASALNDVTWLTFALIAALDRLAHQLLAEGERPVQPVTSDVQPLWTWRPPSQRLPAVRA